MENNLNLFIVVNSIKALCDIIFECEGNDGEDDIDVYLQLANVRGEKPVRITGYYNVIIPSLTEKQFQSHFRVTVEAFEVLENMISPFICSKANAHRQTVEPRKQILMVLWLLATPDSFRSIGERFDVGKSTLWACFYRVIKALNGIASRIITWPDEARRAIIANKFRTYGPIANVVGAVDGTYVPIKAPKENPEAYVNRKCFHGITLQAISDASLRFLHVYAGWPSSVSDGRIFKNFDIYSEIMSTPEQYLSPEQFIIGDKAYPLYKWCIPPYINRGNLGYLEHNFNRGHASMRQVIERTFALFFGRMRRMRYLDMNRHDLYCYTIKAACVIHNVCLLKTDQEINNYITEGLQQVREHDIGDENEAAIDLLLITNEGRQRRNRIALDILDRPRERPRRR